MGTVRAEIEIAAPPEQVWAILSNLSGWSAWNDVLVDGRCEGHEGGRVSVKVAVAGPIWFPVRSRTHTWDEHRKLEWGENRGRIARINHGFTVEPTATGSRVVHYESFEGLVGRLVFPLVNRPLTRNYAAFLKALKHRVEG